MGLFDKLRGKSANKPAINIDFTKTLDVVSAYGEILEHGTSLIRPMKDLPFSKYGVRSALAFGAAGGAIPFDTAREAYGATEGFWPSPAAVPFIKLHARITEHGASEVSPKEIAEYAETIQSVAEGQVERQREFDLLVKWYQGLIVHLKAADRRLTATEAGILKGLLQRSVARDGAWFSVVMDMLKANDGSIAAADGSDVEGFAKEVNFVNHDLAGVRKLLNEIPN